MVDGKLYKTKLCVLYQRGGRCPRQSCSFAHGTAELRRFPGSYNGRRDYRGSDLRDKLGRRQSLHHRYSPVRNARGYSPSRSFERRSDRRSRRKQRLDGHSDYSGDLRNSDGSEERVKEGKITPSDSRNLIEEQLKHVHFDINVLDQRKYQLEIKIEEKIQEVESLTSRIEELEAQLSNEKVECKRLTSKVKKFTKAHTRHSRIQDELKRSQAQLQKLGDQLGSDAAKSGGNEEDSSINIVSDGETACARPIISQDDIQNNVSPSMKRLRLNLDVGGGSKPFGDAIRTAKLYRWNEYRPVQSEHNEEVDAENKEKQNTEWRSQANEGKRKRGKNDSGANAFSDKLKGMELGLVPPPTSMAAHAVDDIADAVEVEEKTQDIGTVSARLEKEGSLESTPAPFPLPPPPPPPIPQNAYEQYKGDDDNVDVEGLEDGAVDVDDI